jgi:hypothetical protein
MTGERYVGIGLREVIINMVTVVRVSGRSVRERRGDALPVDPNGDSLTSCLEAIARR